MPLRGNTVAGYITGGSRDELKAIFDKLVYDRPMRACASPIWAAIGVAVIAYFGEPGLPSQLEDIPLPPLAIGR